MVQEHRRTIKAEVSCSTQKGFGVNFTVTVSLFKVLTDLKMYKQREVIIQHDQKCSSTAIGLVLREFKRLGGGARDQNG